MLKLWPAGGVVLQEGALVCDGGWCRYPAQAHTSRFEKFTAHQERRCDAGELEQAAGGWQQLSPGPGWGFQKGAGYDRKESPLQSGEQLTLEMRSTIPSLVSHPYLRLLVPKLSDHTHLRTVELRLLRVGRTWALD